jgi:hypothetical protein
VVAVDLDRGAALAGSGTVTVTACASSAARTVS